MDFSQRLFRTPHLWLFLTSLICLPHTGQAQDVDTTFRYYFYDQRYSLFDELEPAPGKIVMLGNSITNGGNWSEIFNNSKIINRGISGDNTFGILNRLHQVTSSQPEKIFLLIGINDISKNTPVETILHNYEQIIEQILNDAPQTQLYVQSLLPTNNIFKHFPDAQNKDHQIQLVNKGIHQLAMDYEVTFIDLYPHFLDDKGMLSEKFTNDGLHLLGKGYMKWAEILRPYIEEVDERTQETSRAFGGLYYDRRRAMHESIPKVSGGVVMLGNSITEHGFWNEYFPDVAIMNRGIGGDNIQGIIDRLPAIIKGEPSKVFIMAGINNLLFRETGLDRLNGEYEKMIQEIQASNGSTEIFVQSVLPVNEVAGDKKDFFRGADEKIAMFNHKLKNLAEQHNLVFIDLHSHFSDDSGRLRTALTTDGIHLNGQGYLLWVKQIREFIENP